MVWEALPVIFLISFTLGTLFVILENLTKKKAKREKRRTLYDLVKKVGEKSSVVELPPPIEEELKRRRKSAK